MLVPTYLTSTRELFSRIGHLQYTSISRNRFFGYTSSSQRAGDSRNVREVSIQRVDLRCESSSTTIRKVSHSNFGNNKVVFYSHSYYRRHTT